MLSCQTSVLPTAVFDSSVSSHVVMSSRRGEANRSRPQRHQNRTAFKNDLHDTSHRTKHINSLNLNDVCDKCMAILQWKVKYKKYKPLTAPGKCVKCEEKCVKKAYRSACDPCARLASICPKCLKPYTKSEEAESGPVNEEEFKETIKALPERKRRTLLRYINKQNERKTKKRSDDDKDSAEKDAKLAEKIARLKLESKTLAEENEDFSSDFNDSDLDSDEFSD